MKIDIFNTTEKYKLIYADPAWKFNNKKTGGSMKSSAESNYTVTTIEDMKAMPVFDLADQSCLLAMWWVGAMPQEAIDLVHAWGFRIVNMNGIVWNKLTKTNKPFFGMGFYTRAGSESIVLAVKGKFKPESRSVRAVFNAEAQIQFEAKVMAHSKKPVEVRAMLEELTGDAKKIELFARSHAEGWDCWGDEA